MTLERSERRLPPTDNQMDMLYFLQHTVNSAPAKDIMRLMDTEDDIVDAVGSVIAESYIQGLIEPTAPYAGKGKTKWKITPKGRSLLREYSE